MHDNLAFMLHIRTIPANHTIQTNIPDFLRHFRLTTSRTDIDQMPIFPRLTNSLDSGFWNAIVIIHQSSVYI